MSRRENQIRLSTLFLLVTYFASIFGLIKPAHPVVFWACLIWVVVASWILLIEGVYWLDHEAPTIVRKVVNALLLGSVLLVIGIAMMALVGMML